MNVVAKAFASTVPVADITSKLLWADCTPDDDPDTGRCMIAQLCVHGCNLHLVAFEVEEVRAGYDTALRAVDPNWQEDFDRLTAMADGIFELMKFENKLWAVYAHPHQWG